MQNRIKNIQTNLPRGTPLESPKLRGFGVSGSLAHEYVKAGWLEKLGRGVFMFAGDELARDASLKFLERKIPGLHVAAKTALAWHGFRHNVAHRETMVLWGNKRAILPEWFKQRFPARYSMTPLFGGGMPPGFGLAPLPGSPDGPLVSGPERALLEMLSEIGVGQEMEEGRAIMEGVRQLRAGQLGVLLANCRMVKAARLCVIWAEELGLPWAVQARGSVAGKWGTSRWVSRLKNGRTLILNP